jgi:hypothetical protein
MVADALERLTSGGRHWEMFDMRIFLLGAATATVAIGSALIVLYILRHVVAWAMPLDQTTWPSPITESEITDEATALLIRARALVARGWCRGARARNFLGFAVSQYSRWATRWCASGALAAARLVASGVDYRRAQLRLIAAMGDEYIFDFNDRQRTVQPVLAAFDRAIRASAWCRRQN